MNASRRPDEREGGEPAILDMLIRAGADVNIADKGGCTALMRACMTSVDEYNNERTLGCLIGAGSDTNARSNDGQTILMRACWSDWIWRVEALMNSGQNIDIDAIDNEGNTALMLACRRRSHGIVRHLVQKGANINVINNDGYTALTIARHYELWEVCGVLEQHQNQTQTTSSP